MTPEQSFGDLAIQQLARIQRIALVGVDLAHSTRRMLFCLDRYWQAYEERYDWERLWWEAFERERTKVEDLLKFGAGS